MKTETEIKKIFDKWDKSLTADMRKHWKQNANSVERKRDNSEMHSRFWFARDVVRHIRAEIFELED